MTAMSVSSSVPITRACNSLPLDSETTILSAWPTTWLLVTITPDASITKPDPAPCTWSRRVRRRSRNCFSNGVPRRAAGSCASAPATLSVTAMLTTEGTTRLTSGASEGSAPRNAAPPWASDVLQPDSDSAAASRSGRARARGAERRSITPLMVAVRVPGDKDVVARRGPDGCGRRGDVRQSPSWPDFTGPRRGRMPGWVHDDRERRRP